MSVVDRVPKLGRYLSVGATGVPVDLAVTTAAAAAVSIVGAQAVGWFVAATWNWFWNRRLTWESNAHAGREWGRYLVVDIGRLLARIAFVAGIVRVAPELPNVVVTATGIGVAAAFGFFGFDKLVFKENART